jgi:nucleoside-diphosphate-sugar epimerase
MTTSILVTGGTGTLGGPVAQRLRDAGASVTVLSRHPAGNRRRHPLHRR